MFFGFQPNSPEAEVGGGGTSRGDNITGEPSAHISRETYYLHNAYANLMEILSGASFPPNTYSLFNSYSTLMEILSGATFPPNT